MSTGKTWIWGARTNRLTNSVFMHWFVVRKSVKCCRRLSLCIVEIQYIMIDFLIHWFIDHWLIHWLIHLLIHCRWNPAVDPSRCQCPQKCLAWVCYCSVPSQRRGVENSQLFFSTLCSVQGDSVEICCWTVNGYGALFDSYFQLNPDYYYYYYYYYYWHLYGTNSKNGAKAPSQLLQSAASVMKNVFSRLRNTDSDMSTV